MDNAERSGNYFYVAAALPQTEGLWQRGPPRDHHSGAAALCQWLARDPHLPGCNTTNVQSHTLTARVPVNSGKKLPRKGRKLHHNL